MKAGSVSKMQCVSIHNQTVMDSKVCPIAIPLSEIHHLPSLIAPIPLSGAVCPCDRYRILGISIAVSNGTLGRDNASIRSIYLLSVYLSLNHRHKYVVMQKPYL